MRFIVLLRFFIFRALDAFLPMRRIPRFLLLDLRSPPPWLDGVRESGNGKGELREEVLESDPVLGIRRKKFPVSIISGILLTGGT